jgi:hypothetical protein
MELNIHRKHTYIDIIINFNSNHPHNHKVAGCHYYINRLNSLPITNTAAEHEWKQILNMAHNNGFPKHTIQEVRNKKRQKANTATHTQPTLPQPKIWTKFTFHSPAIRKVTNLFKNTNLKIAFRTTNKIFQQLSQKTINNDPPGLYSHRRKQNNVLP